ncbi:hypothetical protein [Pleurocapsa sp. FMAR1]|uniref:hypothetical protein n=1 Tax=Pleurocapsa sp. FMAR1 TaxID=3040204 RepID=UPI0029C7F25B|nr:hypothetical protein [Pleurocapsa sp. FMAR1]
MHEITENIALSPKQLQAITLLSTGTSVGDTAKELDVNPCTLNRWGHQTEFKKHLRQVSTANLRHQLMRFHEVLDIGVTRLLAIIKEPQTESKDVIRIVKLALDSTGNFEYLDMHEQLAEIRQKLDEE